MFNELFKMVVDITLISMKLNWKLHFVLGKFEEGTVSKKITLNLVFKFHDDRICKYFAANMCTSLFPKPGIKIENLIEKSPASIVEGPTK